MHVCLQWKTHPFSEPNRKRRREKQEQAPAAGSLCGRRLVTSSRAARPVQCGRAALLPASPHQGGPCLQAPQRWRLRLVATVNSSIYLTDVKVKRAPHSAPRGHRQALQACTPRSHVHTGGGGSAGVHTHRQDTTPLGNVQTEGRTNVPPLARSPSTPACSGGAGRSG